MLNKALNVGVIGLGIGKEHAKGVKATAGACLYAICDPDTARAADVAAELSVSQVFTDYRQMLADPAIDAVIIASPDQFHRQMATDALAAGKHILCEKPLALTREDCEAMISTADASSRKLMVGQVCRFTPSFQKAKELIDQGAIGQLTFVESEYAHDYTEIYAKNSWRSDPLRNGVVGGGCHAVDLLRWIAGDPEEVMAYGTHKTFADTTPYDDTHIAILKFPGGVIGKVFISISCKRDYTMRSVFYGTRGTIIVDNTSPTMTLFRDRDDAGNDTHDQPITIAVPVNNHNVTDEFREFFRVVSGEQSLAVTAREGANTIAVCAAIMDSAAWGRPVCPAYFR